MALTADFLKSKACEAIDKSAPKLEEVSNAIWNKPELLFEEHFAHKRLTAFLEDNGFPVERHFIVETGFRSIYDKHAGYRTTGRLPNVAVLCEYDALPDIGHGCGHNLIAEVGVGAAIGIKAALDVARDSGVSLGTLTVLGTPAEEGGYGKVRFIEGKAFDSVDAAIMAHPAHVNMSGPLLSAFSECTVTYKGKASHAAGFPWEGVNALDAAFLAYSGISVLRQQMKPTWRVHGVVKSGGTVPQIIPDTACLHYFARTASRKELFTLKDKLTSCFEAAATATGCEVTVAWGNQMYEDMITNPTLASLYEKNASPHFDFEPNEFIGGSTDMGNVSYVVPSIHPMFAVGANIPLHTEAYAQHAGLSSTQPFALTVAKLLAMTAIDVYLRPELVNTMRAELDHQLVDQ